STTFAPTTTESPDNPYGGTARLWMRPPPASTFNPWTGYTAPPLYALFTVGALEVDYETFTMNPDVITEVPTEENGGLVVNADETLTVTYQIRPDAFWADGTPISGDDFRFTYEIGVANPGLSREYYEMIVPESIDIGPKTFSYTLGGVTNGWMDLFLHIVPRHDVEGSDFLADWNDRPWLSAGPFQYVSGDLRDVAVFEPNPTYWKRDPDTGQQLPYLARIEVGSMETERIDATLPLLPDRLHDAATRIIKEDWTVYEEYGVEDIEAAEAAMVEAESRRFLDGTVHAFDSFVLVNPAETASSMARFFSTPGITGGPEYGTAWEHFGFQFGPNRSIANPDSLVEHLRFRQAVAHAIDRERIAEQIWQGLVEPVDSFSEIVRQESPQPWSRYDYNPDQARALLQDLCGDLGRDCEEAPPSLNFVALGRLARLDLAELLTEMLGAVGITVNWEVSFGTVREPFETTAFSWGMSAGAVGVASFLDVFDRNADTETTYWNPYRWCSADSVASGPACDRFDQIIDELRQTLDLERALELAHEAEQIMADELVVIPLYRWPGRQLWRTDLIEGLGTKYGVELAPPLYGCDEWFMAEGDG
nr:ABC transporter substrate-binding protein [Acidimicrobiia bacterium]